MFLPYDARCPSRYGVGYCFGIRSERRLCDEVHLNLAYRWFCRLWLDGAKNRHGRFRESDLLRHLFESVLQRCLPFAARFLYQWCRQTRPLPDSLVIAAANRFNWLWLCTAAAVLTL
jgi:hypothetical protein